MKNNFFFLTFFISGIIISLHAQNTYYISNSTGNDSNSGTELSPWKSLSIVKDSAQIFKPGDFIKFKKGDIWKDEKLEIADHPSGNSCLPITYTSYGTGSKPIIDIVEEKTGLIWNHEEGNLWSTCIEWGDFARYFKNGKEMLRGFEKEDLGTQKVEYWFENYSSPNLNNCSGNNFTGKLWIYSENGVSPSSQNYSWSKYSSIIKLENADYIQIIGLDLRGGSNEAIKIENNENWIIKECNIGLNSEYGITTKNSSSIFIENNNFDSNFTVDMSEIQPENHPGYSYRGCQDGILIREGSNNIIIKYNFFKNWGHASIGGNTSNINNRITNVTIFKNILTSPDILYGGRIGYSGYFEDSEISYNLIQNISVQNQLGGSRNHFHHNTIDGVLDSPLKRDAVGNGILIQNYNEQIKSNIIENNIIRNTDSFGINIYPINFEYEEDGPDRNKVNSNIIRNNSLINCGINNIISMDNIGSIKNVAIQYFQDYTQGIHNNQIINNYIYNASNSNNCLFGDESAFTIINGSPRLDRSKLIITDVNSFNSLNSNYISNNYANIKSSYILDQMVTENTIPSTSFSCLSQSSETSSFKEEKLNNIDNISQSKIGSEIKLFPNPTTGQIEILLDKKYQEIDTKLQNISGQTLYQKTFRNTNSFSFEIDYDSSIYLIEILLDNKDKIIKKIVKE